jgi:hypothetical protein
MERNMKTIIRHPSTGYYFARNATWTESLDEARTFERSHDCVVFALRERLPKFEAVALTQGGRLSMVIFERQTAASCC